MSVLIPLQQEFNAHEDTSESESKVPTDDDDSNYSTETKTAK